MLSPLRGFFITSLAFLLLAGAGRAGIVTGTVVDGAGTPQAGATVEVFLVGSSATTDVAGAFSISLPDGTYALQIIPPSGSSLAPLILPSVVVNGTLSLGALTLPTGFVITGTVLDPNGAPIVGGDLDVFDEATGIKIDTPNDNTDASGNFSLIVPAGLLRVRAEPVAGQLLVAQQQTLTVSANTALPTFVLPVGFSLSGTVVQAGTNLPLAGVDIDVDNLFTGERIQTPGDNTDALGIFSVIVPAGVYRVSFEPVKGQQILVGQVVNAVSVNAATNIGTVTMQPGVSISGVVRNGSGFPVASVDLDVRTQAGDTTLYTPGDSSDPDGSFFIVVPAGMHRVIFQPLKSSLLVAQSTPVTNFVSATNLGTVTLQSGHLVSGTVLGPGAVPEADCRVRVQLAGGGSAVEVSENASDASGAYSIVLPAGNFDLRFETKKLSFAQDREFQNVSVAGATVLNANLALLPMLVYTDSPAFPGPPVLGGAGTQMVISWGIYNPGGVSSSLNFEVELVDPFGGVQPLLTGWPVSLASQQYVFDPFLVISLPPPNPAFSGLPHLFRLRLRDPASGAEIDRDEFVYITP